MNMTMWIIAKIKNNETRQKYDFYVYKMELNLIKFINYVPSI